MILSVITSTLACRPNCRTWSFSVVEPAGNLVPEDQIEFISRLEQSSFLKLVAELLHHFRSYSDDAHLGDILPMATVMNSSSLGVAASTLFDPFECGYGFVVQLGGLTVSRTRAVTVHSAAVHVYKVQITVAGDLFLEIGRHAEANGEHDDDGAGAHHNADYSEDRSCFSRKRFLPRVAAGLYYSLISISSFIFFFR